MRVQCVMRVNGFEQPFHPLQVLSWVVFGSNILVFGLVAIPLIENRGTILAVSISYGVSVLLLVVAAVRATGCNPADPDSFARVVQGDLSLEQGVQHSRCPVCQLPVLPKSRHCRACNKCVPVFDHHCMWLNNCIGERNYYDFLGCIYSVAVMTGISLVVCVYVFIDQLDDPKSSPIGLPSGVSLALLCALVVVNFPLFVLDMQLVILHAFLAHQQLTTYEYIMGKREMEAESDEDRQKRSTAPRRVIRTLPRCMDWIVFVRPGKRKRSPRIDQVHAQEEEASAKVDPGPIGKVSQTEDDTVVEQPPEASKEVRLSKDSGADVQAEGAVAPSYALIEGETITGEPVSADRLPDAGRVAPGLVAGADIVGVSNMEATFASKVSGAEELTAPAPELTAPAPEQ